MNKKELRYLRIKNKLTQQQISNSLGISCDRYSRIERGFVVPTEEECEKMAEFLGICEQGWQK